MLKKIRSLVSNSKSFLEIYDNVIPEEECDILVAKFEKSITQRGKLLLSNSQVGELPEYKSCTELVGTNFKEGDVISNIIKQRLHGCIDKYNEKYHSCLSELGFWGIDEFYNVQRYDGDEEGYFAWHTERGHSLVNSKRLLVWMFYLNDAQSGTEFVNFPTVEGKKGRCVVWPAGWEYTHRGVTPNKGLKYIATGLCSYLNPKDLPNGQSFSK